MKCKFGAIVVDGRNKIGGHVASKNRAGSYFRTKVTPTNPRTTFQVNVRNRLAGLSSAWRGLDPDERTAWNAAVANFARTDIFGDLRNPSGFNLHQMLNNNLLKVSAPIIKTPPLPQAVDAFTSFSIAAAETAETLTLTFAPVIDATHKVMVTASPGLSAGISFVESEYRIVYTLLSTHSSPFEIGGYYKVKFGAIPVAGAKIFVRLTQVVIATGQAGIPIQASCIVAA